MPAPSREDFIRWRDDYVTRWVFKALSTAADDQQKAWMDASWTQGASNPANDTKTMNMLRELRTRADAYLSMEQASYEAVCEMNGEEPREE
jgi:hypothetical protein